MQIAGLCRRSGSARDVARYHGLTPVARIVSPKRLAVQTGVRIARRPRQGVVLLRGRAAHRTPLPATAQRDSPLGRSRGQRW